MATLIFGMFMAQIKFGLGQKISARLKLWRG